MDKNPKYDSVFDSDDGKTWLDHMTGYLTWKVSGPDINNPYKQPPTVPFLRRMLVDEGFLMSHVTVRCTCDGHEVMLLTNPTCPRIQSDHPSVSSLSTNKIMEYMLKNKIDELIFTEVDKLRVEVDALVKALESKKTPNEKKGLKPKAAGPAKPSAKPQETQLRIIRR